MQLLRPLQFALIIFFVSFCMIGHQTEAHPMPNTVIELQLAEENVLGKASIPLDELLFALQKKSIEPNGVFIKEYLRAHIQAKSNQGDYLLVIRDINIESSRDYVTRSIYEELVVRFELQSPTNAATSFDLFVDLIAHQLVTHKIHVFLNQLNKESGDLELQLVGILEPDASNNVPPLSIHFDTQADWGLVMLTGMKHILHGIDHLLFLLTLLLIAPLARLAHGWSSFQGTSYCLRRFLKISLAFTIGHSTTLLIGSFNFFPMSSRIIESLVAISIIVSAAHCIRPLFYKKEVWLTGAFGLIHGAAFAESISNLSLSWSDRLLHIFLFNVGIEVMQIVLMAGFFPVMLLSRFNGYRYLRMAVGVLTIIVGLAWTLERLQGSENLISHYINSWVNQ